MEIGAAIDSYRQAALGRQLSNSLEMLKREFPVLISRMTRTILAPSFTCNATLFGAARLQPQLTPSWHPELALTCIDTDEKRSSTGPSKNVRSAREGKLCRIFYIRQLRLG
jgi:hypothetical protein